VAYFKVISRNLSQRAELPRKPSIKTAGLSAVIRIQDLTK
jgi:hypothetical protein